MAQIEIGTKPRVHTNCAINLQKKIAKESSREHADGEAGHAEARRKQNPAEDNHHVVDDRRKGRNQKSTLGVLHGAEDAALIKTKLRREHQPSQKNQSLVFR